MREIKFRAWDEESPAMLSWEDIQEQWNSDGYYPAIFSGDHYYCMQYTGLKDKNGVEIYEGDIVKDQHSYSDANIGKVWYRAVLGNPVDWMVNGNYMSSMSSEIEVIGNIYQNSELLKP